MKKYIRHFMVITKHKLVVMAMCFKAGIYWRGIMHDLSKYSFAEFFTSAKYFQGDSSPIDAEKKEKGYSFAWLHHRGKNPHHWEYWMDNFSKGGEPMRIPYQYALEMVCDWIGAGKVYNAANWSKEEPLKYFETKVRRGEIILNSSTFDFIYYVLQRISNDGLNAIGDKKLIKEVYRIHNGITHIGTTNNQHWSHKAKERFYSVD